MPGFEPNKKMREVDKLTKDINSWWGRTFLLIRKARIRTWKGVAVLAFIAGVAAAVVWLVSVNIQTSSDAKAGYSPLMKPIKKAGCVADGILSNYGGNSKAEAAMIKRSECRYMHRALETWAHPPDFVQAKRIMDDIKKERPDMIFGMFLAEAVNPNARYYYADENRNFNFSRMCRQGSEGFWGENTCKGYFGSKEYRKYIKYITRQAIDAGIQSFLIGQIHFQDNGTGIRSWAKEIVGDMRSYAAKTEKEIVIGAQTNSIDDEDYLRLFDFIEGGIGIDSKGEIEDGPCFSKWSRGKDSCWALLWHERFSKKANDVLLHLDWSGFYDDDMSIFARMSREKRAENMEKMHEFFLSRDMGFLLPYFAVINENNGSCYGPQKNYYSASNNYSCRDEDAFNAVLEKAWRENGAKFLVQSVPFEMIVGEVYRAEIRVRNTGNTTWSEESGFRLGSQNPQDNETWGSRLGLGEDEEIRPGEVATFIFTVKAPSEPGEYDFQWRMVEEGVEWFGENTKNVKIIVSEKENQI